MKTSCTRHGIARFFDYFPIIYYLLIIDIPDSALLYIYTITQMLAKIPT